MSDARSTGMGESYVSVANEANAVFWNPAGLSNIKSYDFSASYVDYFMDVSHMAIAAAYNYEGIGTFALQAIMTDIGDISVTRVDQLGRDPITGVYNPGLTGETVSPSSQLFGLSFARSVTDKFSFGLSVKYAHEDLVEKQTGSIMFDGGILYDTGYKSLRFGISLRHFGPEIKFIDKSYPLPQTLTLGISGYLFAPENYLIAGIEDQSLLFSYDLSQPRDYSQQHQVGMEYSFNDMLFLRGGYKINYDEEDISLGAGVAYKNYKIDYSYNNYGEYLGSVHRFTIGFSGN